jgi:tyrosyl-tRNA synthetase
MTDNGERGNEAIERVPPATTGRGAPRVDEQLAALARRADQIVPEADLRAKLERSARTGSPLRVKLGMDPTAPDVTLGHAVPLRVVRQFQDWGHRAVLIIGDYTARVGDPSGRNATRPILSGEAIDANAATYVAQVGKILRTDPAHLEVRRNGEWLAGMSLVDVIRLASRATVAQMLQRDDFAARFAGRVEIRLHEILYPLLQGWDSVMIAADVELGGRDQLFNNLVGREIQRQEGGEGQVVIVTPLLVGLDGKEKMSKSRGNYIGVTDPPAGPDGMFGKIMSLPDTLMDSYYTLLTDEPPERYRPRLAADPRAAKAELARLLVRWLHGPAAADPAEAQFEKQFSRGQAPDEMPEVSVAALGPGPPTAAAAGASEPGREQRRGRAQDARGRGLCRRSPRHRCRPDRHHRSADRGQAGPALRPPRPLRRAGYCLS